MRKIEKAMNDAVNAKINWHGGNTEVRVAECGSVFVFLFGHLIMHQNVRGERKYDAKIAVTDGATATTLSRLRALGLNVSKRKSVLYVDGKEWPFGYDFNWRPAK